MNKSDNGNDKNGDWAITSLHTCVTWDVISLQACSYVLLNSTGCSCFRTRAQTGKDSWYQPEK